MTAYALLLGLIYLQNRYLKRTLYRYKARVLFFVNVELLIFLTLYHFVFGGDRFLNKMPWIGESQTFTTLFSLALYLIGLAVFYCTSFDKTRLLSSAEMRSPLTYAEEQLRFLVPFAIPFILFTFFLDLLKFYPNKDLQDVLLHNSDNAVGSLILFGCSIGFLILMMIFLPAIIQRVWLCQPIEDSPLKTRLDSLCKKAHFRHAGMKTWTVMNQSLTAAIIGIVPRFRYVMFTKKLIQELSPEAVEAILAHEIGHSYRKHLLIYPIIILGMFVSAGLFSLFFGEAMAAYFSLKNIISHSPWWDVIASFAFFIPFVIIIAIYFRLIFGFFSRNFERQADLHVFELGVPPEHMIEALDEVAIRTGNTHFHPSWHHYSLQERIDFIKAAIKDPNFIASHHKRVKRLIWIYAGLLLVAFTILLAPLAPKAPVTGQINKFIERIVFSINNSSTYSLRRELAEKTNERLHLRGDLDRIQDALEKGFEPFIATQYPGLGEYFAAKILLDEGEFSSAAVLMADAWLEFDFKKSDVPEIKQEFEKTTQAILEKLDDKFSVEKQMLKSTRRT